MLFKFLEKPIEITAFLPPEYFWIQRYFEINVSSAFAPNWWKKCPRSSRNDEDLTIKRSVKSCVGIIETFKNGYIIPLWSDLSIKTSEQNWEYRYSDQMSRLDHHPNDQFPNFYDNFYSFKISSPWLLEASTDIKLIYMNPFYTSTKPNPYISPWGIVRTIDKKATTNVFLFLEKKKQSILINESTPILQFIPLTEKPVKFKTEVISDDEYLKKNSFNVHFTFTSKGLKLIKKLGNKNG